MFADPCAMALSSFDLQFTVGAAACRGGRTGRRPRASKTGGHPESEITKI